jgi:hypothetical protein
MKKLFIILVALMVIASCATTKEVKSTRVENRKEKKLAEQEAIKKAVESRRYIIKLDRIYFSHGGRIDLIPRANYIIVDGEKTIISAAYMGRQYDIKPIAGISLYARALNYQVTNNPSKGTYQVELKVEKGGDAINAYLTIGKNGYCNVSFTSLKIDYVRYSGRIVPLADKSTDPPRESIVI